MRQIFILLSAAFLIASCGETNEKKSGGKFSFLRHGKFKYEDNTPGMYLVKRYDTYQDEYLTYYDMDVRFSIKWLNDSMYEMRFDTILNNPKNVELYSDITELVKTCVVSELTDSSYIEKATTNLHDRTEYTEYVFLK